MNFRDADAAHNMCGMQLSEEYGSLVVLTDLRDLMLTISQPFTYHSTTLDQFKSSYMTVTTTLRRRDKLLYTTDSSFAERVFKKTVYTKRQNISIE